MADPIPLRRRGGAGAGAEAATGGGPPPGGGPGEGASGAALPVPGTAPALPGARHRAPSPQQGRSQEGILQWQTLAGACRGPTAIPSTNISSNDLSFGHFMFILAGLGSISFPV